MPVPAKIPDNITINRGRIFSLSIYLSIDLSIDLSINQSIINQSINQPTNQSINQSINQSCMYTHQIRCIKCQILFCYLFLYSRVQKMLEHLAPATCCNGQNGKMNETHINQMTRMHTPHKNLLQETWIPSLTITGNDVFFSDALRWG